MTKQRSLPEWKLVQSKESEITKQKTNRESFSFSGSSLEFRNFKAGGSSKLEVAGLDHIPNQASLDTKNVAVVGATNMSMDPGSGLKALDITKPNSTPQETIRQPFVEMAENQHMES